MKRLIVISLFTAVCCSCDKESNIRYKFAGVWHFTELEVSYFTNNAIDSSYSATDIGTWLLSDNASDTYNQLHYVHTKTPPASFQSFAISAQLSQQEDYTYWYTDGTTDHRFTLHEELYIGATYKIYTVLDMDKNKFILQYVESDNSNPQYLKYKEVMTFKRD